MSPDKFYKMMLAQGRLLTIHNGHLVIEPAIGLSAVELIYLASHGQELRKFVEQLEAS